MLDKQTKDPIWLCLRFTHFALNSLGIHDNTEVANAIVEQQQLVQCNRLAEQSGVRAAMSVNHALMLNPAIELHERDPAQEARKIHELSYWAYRFTSQVCIHKDDTLLLEVGRSIKLFKGLSHLINLINHDLSAFGFNAMSGIAHTPKAAYVLSFSDSVLPTSNTPHVLEKLRASHIHNLDIEQKIIRQLQHCGFATLKDLDPISAAELGRRFGDAFLRYMDQLWGRVADPQYAITPPETFAASADFAEPIRNLAWINQQLDRLLHDLAHFIKIRNLLCRSFVWRFYHENNRLLETVNISLSAKQNNVATFRELTDLKLSTLTLSWEFSSIELSSTQLVPKTLFNNDLFDPQPDQEQFQQLIDKLTNRLGHHALFRVHAAPEYLPELANDRQSAVQEHPAKYEAHKRHVNVSDAEANPFKDQPLWLLETPQRLPQARADTHKNQPMLDGPLSIIHGPDRITSHWWSKIQSRDYFIARQRSGRLLWLYFDRKDKNWFLHGLFA